MMFAFPTQPYQVDPVMSRALEKVCTAALNTNPVPQLARLLLFIAWPACLLHMWPAYKLTCNANLQCNADPDFTHGPRAERFHVHRTHRR